MREIHREKARQRERETDTERVNRRKNRGGEGREGERNDNQVLQKSSHSTTLPATLTLACMLFSQTVSFPKWLPGSTSQCLFCGL